jgi:transposase
MVATKEPPTMSTVTMIGLDTAKSAFQVHAVDAGGKPVIRRKLSRSELIPFFTKQAACTVVMEACGAAHHWSRLLTGLGHTVKLIAPEAVSPFVKKGKKNDAADAVALCEAASRPDMKFVPTKKPEQQAILALHSARSLLVRQQTMLVNAMRGLATEFGLIVPKGIGRLGELVALVDQDEALPETARVVLPLGGVLFTLGARHQVLPPVKQLKSLPNPAARIGCSRFGMELSGGFLFDERLQ